MKRACHFRRICPQFPVIWLAMMACSFLARAALPSLDPPEHFFTNIADRLLQQQLGVRLGEIQVAPANQYDTAVHRLFQVTANIYDATSTNEFPAVFRPLFETRSNGVFLAGFTNDNSASTVDAWLATNPYGLPMVIAARKGFPNFNELSIRSEFLVIRRLEIQRPSLVSGTRPSATNQMYILSISNNFTVESWYPYTGQPYPRALTILVSNYAAVSLTNLLGRQMSNSLQSIATTNLPRIPGWEVLRRIAFACHFPPTRRSSIPW